ncbi:HpcH/HpaI aldolase/citrate lyase family protein [Sphingosinicella sp. YJ22]|uniref:HpcH/HpaI aldolase/citrate lyase family protein n=1 Tax=Sphingosinicella sp. YJ22 TaxID=1104780 RepID=UPI00140AD80A|nr:HpcH/HpaI aldolase/citrate lyase family protein [Sphingosinicella sp. YJ22]
MDALELGATLYVPATRTDLFDIVSGRRHPGLRSAVLCLEDSIRPADVPQALTNLAVLLERLGEEQARLPVFIRPRDDRMLAHILGFAGIEAIQGFVIPKATADSLPSYLRALASDAHLLMPTLETREAFDQAELARMREQLLAIQERILCIRIGGNDLLHTIGARRSAVRTAYEGPLGGTIAGLVTAFAPFGFALSAPVFEHFDSPDLLREEVEHDIEHGLLTKTAIHPAQIEVIQSAYRVRAAELAEAREILSGDRGVFALNGSMCEPATHRRWAEAVVKRAAIYGVHPEAVAAAV